MSNKIDLLLTWTKTYNKHGFRSLKLELRNNGKAVDGLWCYSGFGSRQKENYIWPSKDWAGSGRPIPEGVYSIGKPAIDGQSAIGKWWVPVKIKPQFDVNNRGAFGFHEDANRSYARGSAGCIVTYNAKDMERIVTWLGHKAKPTELVVDYELGFLKSKGYHEVRAEEVKPEDECPCMDTDRISDKGLELVKHFEGLRTTSYKDIAGVWTVGYGHTKTAKPGQVITESEAERLLRQDMHTFENGVRHQLGNDLPQKHFDALVSFSFNVGLGALGKSTLKRKYLSGDIDGAANEFLRWNKYTDPATGRLKEVAGLTRRRKAERNLFLTGEINYFV